MLLLARNLNFLSLKFSKLQVELVVNNIGSQRIMEVDSAEPEVGDNNAMTEGSEETEAGDDHDAGEPIPELVS